MIAIIDYGRGNLGSVEKAVGRVGIPAVVTQDPRVVDDADGVVLPGDGAFHDAMANLDHLGLLAPLRRALASPRPFLGICLGYQLLFSTSEEFGEGRGLDVITGAVRRFPPGGKIPHMGWNRVHHEGDVRIFEGVPDGAHFYFVHSYYPVVAGAASTDTTAGGRGQERSGSAHPNTDRPSPRDALASTGTAANIGAAADNGRLKVVWCDYGIRFAAAVERGSIHATQFHPEKSQRWGIKLLENFAAIVKESSR